MCSIRLANSPEYRTYEITRLNLRLKRHFPPLSRSPYGAPAAAGSAVIGLATHHGMHAIDLLEQDNQGQLVLQGEATQSDHMVS